MLYKVTVDVTSSADLYIEADDELTATDKARTSVLNYDADMQNAHVIKCDVYDIEEVEDED